MSRDGRTAAKRRLGIDLDRPTVKALSDYRTHMERRGARPGSVVKVLGILRLLAEELHPRPLISARADDVEAWLDARQLTARTRYSYVSHVHGFFEWATIHGRAKADPTLVIARPRFPRSLPRPIADGDLAIALESATKEMRAIVALGAFHGLRAAEIAGLQREDIVDRNDPPVLIVHEGKGGHQRVLPLHQQAWEDHIRPHSHGRDGWLFPHSTTVGRPRAPWAVSHAINAYFDDLGIEATCHSLRHWYGTKVYAASRDLRVTQALMGHASPNTTIGYVAWSAHDAHAAVAGLAVPA